MGIRNLQRFLQEEHYFQYYKKPEFTFLDLIKGKTLYIDAPSFLSWQVRAIGNPLFNRYRLFKHQVANFKRECDNRDIQLVFVRDGIAAFDTSVWHSRRSASAQRLFKVPETGNASGTRFIDGIEIMQSVLLSSNPKAKVVRALKDADSELVTWAKKDPNLGGIFSMDTDFVLCNLDCYWFSGDQRPNWVKSVYLPNLPFYCKPVLEGLMAAMGEHERAPNDLKALMASTPLDYSQLLDVDTSQLPEQVQNSASTFLTQLFTSTQELQGVPQSLISYYKKGDIPSRYIEIITTQKDFMDCHWYESDFEWTCQVNKVMYGLFTDKPIKVTTYIIDTLTPETKTVEPESGLSYEDLLQQPLSQQQDLLSKAFRMTIRNAPVTAWQTFTQKNKHMSIDETTLLALLYTMILCQYHVTYKIDTSKTAPASTYPTVYRWLSHLNFVLSCARTCRVWNNQATLLTFFDGSVFTTVYDELVGSTKASRVIGAISSNTKALSLLRQFVK